MINTVEIVENAIELKYVSMKDCETKIPMLSEIIFLDINRKTLIKEGITVIPLVDIDSGEYRRKPAQSS
ncbi:MAG: hypothetical protein OSJ45_02280 [Lachnospiraceae bacterium]|nr:hypothetical protein [Lachnospiraceae bacterium]